MNKAQSTSTAISPQKIYQASQDGLGLVKIGHSAPVNDIEIKKDQSMIKMNEKYKWISMKYDMERDNRLN